MTTLEKVRRLEQYVAVSSAAIDPVLGMSIDKLLTRETVRLFGLKARLANQLSRFEKSYDLKSVDFYTRYENGEMGDKMDFIEWAATVEMLANADKRLALLGGN